MSYLCPHQLAFISKVGPHCLPNPLTFCKQTSRPWIGMATMKVFETQMIFQCHDIIRGTHFAKHELF